MNGQYLNPIDMAIFLYSQYKKLTSSKEIAIKCSVIVCDTHIYSENNSPFKDMESWVNDEKYWVKVKQEVNNIIIN